MPPPCVCGYANLKNMSRHKMTCTELKLRDSAKDVEIEKLKEKLDYYESGKDRKELLDEIQSLKSGEKYICLKDENDRLKNEKGRMLDEMIELQKKLLEKRTNVTNVKNVNVTNNYNNNYVLNVNIIATESQLNEKNVHQMIRNSMSQCDEFVPKSLKRKFFSQDSTKNIRFITDESDAKGKLQCKKNFDS